MTNRNIQKKHLAMSTVIYPSPIFGPTHSRRLGVSIGINLMPADGKVGTFDCIYCECGFNAVTTTTAVKQDLVITCYKPSERQVSKTLPYLATNHLREYKLYLT